MIGFVSVLMRLRRPSLGTEQRAVCKELRGSMLVLISLTRCVPTSSLAVSENASVGSRSKTTVKPPA